MSRRMVLAKFYIKCHSEIQGKKLVRSMYLEIASILLSKKYPKVKSKMSIPPFQGRAIYSSATWIELEGTVDRTLALECDPYCAL